MKLYWGPHTCAIGIHILMEEVGADYKTEKLDVGGGDTEKPAFLAINPKGKVPTLMRDDGSVLTEFGAIATWLARAFPKAGLIPQDVEADARVTEVLEYVEGTVHGQGFARIFKPAKFAPRHLHSDVERQGREIIEQAFAILNDQLNGKEFAAGGRFSIADAALFYVERWAPPRDITLPGNIRTHFQRMLARPSVQKVRAFWGEPE